jgi:hypothetical protein
LGIVSIISSINWEKELSLFPEQLRVNYKLLPEADFLHAKIKTENQWADFERVLGDPVLQDRAMSFLATYVQSRIRNTVDIPDSVMARGAERCTDLVARHQDADLIARCLYLFGSTHEEQILSNLEKLLKHIEDNTFLVRLSLHTTLFDKLFLRGHPHFVESVVIDESYRLMLEDLEAWDNSIGHRLRLVFVYRTERWQKAWVSPQGLEAQFQLYFLRPAMNFPEARQWFGEFISAHNENHRAALLRDGLNSSLPQLSHLAAEYLRRAEPELYDATVSGIPNWPRLEDMDLFFGRTQISPLQKEIIQSWLREPKGKPLVAVYLRCRNNWNEACHELLWDLAQTSDRTDPQILQETLAVLSLEKGWKEILDKAPLVIQMRLAQSVQINPQVMTSDACQNIQDILLSNHPNLKVNEGSRGLAHTLILSLRPCFERRYFQHAHAIQLVEGVFLWPPDATTDETLKQFISSVQGLIGPHEKLEAVQRELL